ncbi:protein kinase domain-containing protein [Candidatus Uabimicrobium amorphum]
MFLHYLIEEELGRGGMGVVYKAQDTKLNRTVAFKIILVDIEERQKQRFLQEARAIAQVDHPNVIKVFEVGEEPLCYYTMEYIQGGTLSQCIAQKLLKPTALANIFYKLADALYVMHKQKIVHRDLKPSNIMLSDSGEPKVMDFGLAKVLDSQISQSKDFLGTPAYMSPEQINNDNVDAKSDIYSLGASMYEGLTGRPVFQGDEIFNILYQIVQDDPIDPRRLNPDIPVDLEAICLKCIEKKPRKRYVSMKFLAKDLKNFMENRPISARPPTKIKALQKWVLRNKAITTIFFVALIAMVLSISIVIFSLHQQTQIKIEEAKKLNHEKNKVEMARQQAVTAHEKAQGLVVELRGVKTQLEQSLYRHTIALVDMYNRTGDISKVNYYLNKTQFCPPKARGWEWYWLYRQSNQQLFTLEHENYRSSNWREYFNCFFSRDGKKIFAAISAGIQVWDTNTKAVVKVIRLKKTPLCSDLSPDGRTILFNTVDGNLQLLDVQTQKVIRKYSHNIIKPEHCTFSPDGSMVACSGKEGVYIWKTTQKKLFQKLEKHEKIYACAFSPDNKKIVTGGTFETLQLWDIKSGKHLKEFKGHKNIISYCVYSPDGNKILSTSYDGTMKLWNREGKLLHSFEDASTPEKLLKQALSSCHFSPDGRRVISTGKDNILRLWSVKTGKLLARLKGHNDHILNADYSSDGKNVVTISDDGTLKVWSTLKKNNPQILRGHIAKVNFCSFSSKGNKLISASSDSRLIIWDMKSKKPIKTITGHWGSVRGSLFNESGTKIVSCGKDQTLRIWNNQGKLLKRVTFGEAIRSCTWTPNENVAVFIDKKLIFTDMNTGHQKTVLETAGNIRKIAFHPKQPLILILLESKEIQLRNTNTWKLSAKKKIPDTEATSLTFSPDGKLFVTTHPESINVWETKTFKLLKKLQGHDGEVLCGIFTKDGKRFISNHDHSLQIWNIDTGEPLLTLEGHTGIIEYLTLSKDGTKIASCAQDHTIRIWDIDSFTTRN